MTGLVDRVRDFIRLRREQVTGRQQFELPLLDRPAITWVTLPVPAG